MEKAIQMTVKVSPDTYKAIQKLAVKQNQNMSEIVRKFIDKGLAVQGYRDDLEFITAIIRQVVEAEMDKQAHRLKQIMYKIGVISSSNYFLAVRMLSDVINPSMESDFKDINTNARRLGEEFMEMKYADFRLLMENECKVTDMTDRLRHSFQDEY